MWVVPAVVTEGETPPIRMVCTNANPADVLTEPMEKQQLPMKTNVPVQGVVL